jgi:hypothetical protein
MEAPTPDLSFPTSFCCNCGNLDCQAVVQDTRVTRFFGIRGTESTFHLKLPVCTDCRKTLRRRPPGFFSISFVLVLGVGLPWLLLYALADPARQPPSWIDANRIWISLVLGVIALFVFYRLRRAKPPRTSFYQPVRIKQARVQFGGVMGGPGRVAYLKLAFSNPDYLNSFINANAEAIKSGHVNVAQT